MFHGHLDFLVTAKGYADLAGRQERKWIADGLSLLY